MNNSTKKAIVAKIPIGDQEIDGLMLPDGSYGVAIPQIAELFLVSEKVEKSKTLNYASQKLKRLLGNDFCPHRVSTELGNQKINVVTLKDFEVILAKLDRSGNKAAQDFRDSLVGLSLQQLWSDAFEVKFEKEDRQAWLRQRQQSKKCRRTLTDSIKDYLDNHPELSDGYKKFIYSSCTDAIYLHMFQHKCKELKDLWNVDDIGFKDNLSDKELQWISEVENTASRRIDKYGTEPLQTVKDVLVNLLIPVVGYQR